MKTSERLLLARKLIENENNWTQGVEARTESGTPCVATADGAASWCALGALTYVGDELATDSGYGCMRVALDAWVGPDKPIGAFNDEVCHFEVLELFDRTIAVARDFEQAAGPECSPIPPETHNSPEPTGGLLGVAS